MKFIHSLLSLSLIVVFSNTFYNAHAATRAPAQVRNSDQEDAESRCPKLYLTNYFYDVHVDLLLKKLKCDKSSAATYKTCFAKMLERVQAVIKTSRSQRENVYLAELLSDFKDINGACSELEQPINNLTFVEHCKSIGCGFMDKHIRSALYYFMHHKNYEDLSNELLKDMKEVSDYEFYKRRDAKLGKDSEFHWTAVTQLIVLKFAEIALQKLNSPEFQ